MRPGRTWRTTGGRRVVEADAVVLAAFAFETPRLLLASANQAHPTGLGNTTDLVGRYIMTHNAGLVFGLFDEDAQPTRGALGGQLLNQDSYPKTTHAARGAFGSYQWMIAQAVRPNDLLGMALSRPEVFGAPLGKTTSPSLPAPLRRCSTDHERPCGSSRTSAMRLCRGWREGGLRNHTPAVWRTGMLVSARTWRY
jgi:hypothetical protein